MGGLTKKEFQNKYGYSDETMKRIDIVYKLFHGQILTHNEYAWIEDNKYVIKPEDKEVYTDTLIKVVISPARVGQRT